MWPRNSFRIVLSTRVRIMEPDSLRQAGCFKWSHFLTLSIFSLYWFFVLLLLRPSIISIARELSIFSISSSSSFSIFSISSSSTLSAMSPWSDQITGKQLWLRYRSLAQSFCTSTAQNLGFGCLSYMNITHVFFEYVKAQKSRLLMKLVWEQAQHHFSNYRFYVF